VNKKNNLSHTRKNEIEHEKLVEGFDIESDEIWFYCKKKRRLFFLL